MDYGDNIPESLTCGVCYEIFYKPTTLIPCKHNICGPCYYQTYRSNDYCPFCRQLVYSVTQNISLHDQIEEFLNNQPRHQKSTEELIELSLKKVIKYDIELTRQDEKAIIAALMNRNVIEFSKLLSMGNNIISIDDFFVNKSRPLISYACFLGDVPCTRVLLNHGANMNFCDGDCFTPLAIATKLGHTGCVRLLCEYGVQVDQSSIYDFTALMMASVEGNITCCKILVHAGADINKTCSMGTALIFAASQGHVEVVTFLCEVGVDVSLKTQTIDGLTAFMIAVNNNHPKCVQILYIYGSNIEAKNSKGSTSLINAVYTNNMYMVKLLCQLGADVNTSNITGNTALITACWKGNAKCVAYLCQQGADLNVTDSRGYTALMTACLRGNTECVRVLCQRAQPVYDDSIHHHHHHDHVNSIHHHHNNSIRSSSRNSNNNINNNNTSNRNSNNNNNNNSTNYNTTTNNNSYYTPNTIDIDAVEEGGSTALLIACVCEYTDCVAILCGAGANVTLCNRNRVYPLQAAITKLNIRCIYYICSRLVGNTILDMLKLVLLLVHILIWSDNTNNNDKNTNANTSATATSAADAPFHHHQD